MNCDCIQELTVKMIDHFKPQAGDSVEAQCKGVGINFDTGGMSLSIPWIIRGTARGFKSIKGYDTYIVASFCPFCGTSIKKTAAPAVETPKESS